MTVTVTLTKPPLPFSACRIASAIVCAVRSALSRSRGIAAPPFSIIESGGASRRDASLILTVASAGVVVKGFKGGDFLRSKKYYPSP